MVVRSKKNGRQGWTKTPSTNPLRREPEKGQESFGRIPARKIEFQERTTVEFLDRAKATTRSITFEAGEVVDYLTVKDFDENCVTLESPSGYIAFGVPKLNIVVRGRI